MSFDPDKYIASKTNKQFDPDEYIKKSESAFDPDEYIARSESKFDPDAYTERSEPKADVSEPKPTTFTEGLTTPFGGFYGKEIPQQEAPEDVKKAAQDYLEETGSNTAVQAAAQEFLDTISFGNRAEILAGYESLVSGKSYEEQKALNEAIEKLRREDSPIASTVGSIAGYIAPGGLVGAAGRAAKLGARGIAGLVGAGATAQEVAVEAERAKEGYEAAAIGRTLSEAGLLAGAGAGVAAGYKALKAGAKDAADPKTIKAALAEMDEVDSVQASRIVKKYEQRKQYFDKEIKAIKDLNDNQLEEFEQLILNDKVKDYKYGDLEEALDEYKSLLARRSAVISEAADISEDPAAKIGMKLMDAQYVGNMIDRRYGTDVMRTMNGLSKDYNTALHNAKDLKEAGQQVYDTLGIKNLDDSRRFIEEIESGNIQSEGAQELANFFEELRQVGNNLYGSNVIAARKNYVPHYMKPMPEVIATVRNQIEDAAGRAAKDLDLDDLEEIRNSPELMESLKYVGGFGGKNEVFLNSDNTLLALAKSFGDTSKIQQTIDVAAQSVKERLSEEVPEALREYDIGRLMSRWIDGVTHDSAIREKVRNLRATAATLAPKDKMAADYINNYLKDISGGSRGLAGSANKRMREFATNRHMKALRAEEEGRTKLAAYHRAVAEAPQFAQFLQAQMYPYFLGLRADAVVRNLTQPYLVTVPSIPGTTAYRTKLALRGLVDSARLGYDEKTVKELVDKGWMPPDPTPGSMLALTKGIQQSGKLRNFSRAALEKTNNLAMYLYQQSDLANRVVTVKMGKRLTDDIIKGNKNALKYVDQLPPSYRKKAMEALRVIDQADEDVAQRAKEALEDTVNDHLIATTQFNYNRVSMSEFGREWGSAFSMFSKWPTAIGADIYDGFDAARIAKTRRQTRLPSGTSKFMKKYMGPFIMLSTANAMITGTSGVDVVDAALDLEEERDPTREVLLGRSLQGAAPIQSVMILADPGQAFTPPSIDAAKDLMEGKFNTAFGLVPFGTWGRFMVERFPQYLGEEGRTPQTFLKEEVFE